MFPLALMNSMISIVLNSDLYLSTVIGYLKLFTNSFSSIPLFAWIAIAICGLLATNKIVVNQFNQTNVIFRKEEEKKAPPVKTKRGSQSPRKNRRRRHK